MNKKEFIKNYLVDICWLENHKVATDVFKVKDYVKVIGETRDCVYQVYGDSCIYGLNALLYIGRSKHGEVRLNQHVKGKLGRVLNLSIRFGALKYGESVKENGLSKAERILICSTKPSYNSKSITNIGDARSPFILIHNRGNRGVLPLELSNYWW